MPSAPDLAEFLRARYQEQRELALAATVGPWTAEIHHHRRTKQPVLFEVHPVAELGGNGDGGTLTGADAQHIAAHGPDDVLAELDAKLAIVDEHPNVNDGDCGTCVDGHWGYPTHGGASATRWPCKTLRLLAVSFAAHPDHDERWRP